MRTIKYNGESKNIGRFGFVKKGQQISLTEGEWLCVRESKDYKLVGGDVTAEAIELAKGTLPFGTPLCDLRTIPWENERLSERLSARFSRKQLAEILESMRLVGAAIPEVNMDQDKLFIVDAVVTASVIMGWPALGEDVRVRLPAVTIGPDGKAVIPDMSVEGLRTGLSGFATPLVNTGDAPAAKFDKEGNPIEDAPKKKNKRHKIKPVVELKKVTAPRKRNAGGGTLVVA